MTQNEYSNKSFAEQSCRSCLHHQPGLNPYGCFKRYHSTGWIIRVLIALFGCKGYDYNPKFKEE